ncbi:hypothetical protein I6J18_02895 [Peribacillus psychrosaccharolyticus]|uniref:Uncharacterized protein n=1 Tax=Peribacillus psychrosaccharolyticus TaxID=1407 RepID=A0A974S0Q1_PERPY|nr:hypothetical protein [Peribacillus psychrosaccharolyticus]MEC2055898.1 hypothetical protein [Peribacillus psychrosaccharolyticus]MED3743073.1 hypothetical protein [Peribacillus psychrosaccharolyticus]QQT00882.1 hypothetical protein I6J18_02895 [Peribacillus psychrosaccharolyticus]
MKRQACTVMIFTIALLAGCREETDHIPEVAGTTTSQTDITKRLEQQVESLIEQRDQSILVQEAFAETSSLSFDFMTALKTADVSLLKSVISSEFEYKITDDQWLYKLSEEIDGKSHITIYDKKKEIDSWHITYYGAQDDIIGNSIRVFIQGNDESGPPAMINLNFKQFDGQWKIIGLNTDV